MTHLLLFLWWTVPALAEGFLCAGSQGALPAVPSPWAAAKPARSAASTTGTRQALALFAFCRLQTGARVETRKLLLR